jgi:hypothetical protein
MDRSKKYDQSTYKSMKNFIYKAPQNSRWYNSNFTKKLEGDINNLRESYPTS